VKVLRKTLETTFTGFNDLNRSNRPKKIRRNQNKSGPTNCEEGKSNPGAMRTLTRWRTAATAAGRTSPPTGRTPAWSFRQLSGKDGVGVEGALRRAQGRTGDAGRKKTRGKTICRGVDITQPTKPIQRRRLRASPNSTDGFCGRNRGESQRSER